MGRTVNDTSFLGFWVSEYYSGVISMILGQNNKIEIKLNCYLLTYRRIGCTSNNYHR